MNQTPLMRLRDAALNDLQLVDRYTGQVKLAQQLLAGAQSGAAESGPAFAAAILAAGGDVTDTTTLPPVKFLSDDGKAFRMVTLVEITDEAAPAPTPAPAP